MDTNIEKTYIMANRLKTLREKRGYSHDRLSAVLSEKYGVKISSDSLMNYEVSDPYHSKAGKNQGMRVEYLRILSDFYGVSTDYLLGLTQVASQDQTVQTLVNSLGISELHINLLLNWKNLPSLAEKLPEDLTEDQKHLLAVADELYLMQKRRYIYASEDFFSFFTCILDVIYDHPSSMISNFQYARDAIINDGDISACDQESWIKAYELLEQSGYIALPAENVGEWYLSNIADAIKKEMQNKIERFRYNDIND